MLSGVTDTEPRVIARTVSCAAQGPLRSLQPCSEIRNALSLYGPGSLKDTSIFMKETGRWTLLENGVLSVVSQWLLS